MCVWSKDHFKCFPLWLWFHKALDIKPLTAIKFSDVQKGTSLFKKLHIHKTKATTRIPMRRTGGRIETGSIWYFSLSVVERKPSFTHRPSRYSFFFPVVPVYFHFHFPISLLPIHARSLSLFLLIDNIWLLANPSRIRAIDKTRLPILHLVLLAFQITPIIIMVTCSLLCPTWQTIGIRTQTKPNSSRR